MADDISRAQGTYDHLIESRNLLLSCTVDELVTMEMVNSVAIGMLTTRVVLLENPELGAPIGGKPEDIGQNVEALGIKSREVADEVFAEALEILTSTGIMEERDGQ